MPSTVPMHGPPGIVVLPWLLVLLFVAALFPLFGGDFVAAGILLIASALAFGMLSIAVLGR